MATPSIERTAGKLRLQVRSSLRPPPAGYGNRRSDQCPRMAFCMVQCYALPVAQARIDRDSDKSAESRGKHEVSFSCDQYAFADPQRAIAKD